MPGNSRVKRSEFSLPARPKNWMAMPPSQRSMVLAWYCLRAVTLDRNLHRNPHLHPALAFHQSPNCAKTGLGALHGKRFVQHEVGAHSEAAFKSYRRFHQHDARGALVDRSGLRSP